VTTALRALLTLLVAALALAAPVRAQDKLSVPDYGERIHSFVSDIVVGRDGSLHVTETIRIRSEGNQVRHGIYRDFPTRYARDGRTVRVGFDVEDVRRDGETEEWDTESIDNGTRVRIGSEDEFVTVGDHVYTIVYRTTRQLGFFADYDELYWNVTGNGWVFPIDSAEAHIRLSQAVPFGNRAFYTGPEGAKDSNAEIVEERPGEIRIRTTQHLNAYEGLTVAVAWQKGVVEQPVPPSARDQWLERNAPLIAAGLALAGLGFFYYYAWRRAGRGPVPGTVVPLFAPPENMSAAAVRFVRRMGFDNRAFASAIVESGVRGKLRLVESDEGLFSRTKTRVERTGDESDMQPPERGMLSALFAAGDGVDMVKSNHAVFGAAQTKLREGLDAAYRGTLFLTNKGWATAGLAMLLMAMLFVGLAVLATDIYGDPGLWLVPVIGIVLVGASIFAALRSRFGVTGGSIGLAVLCVLLLTLGGIALVATFPFAAESGRVWPIFLPSLALPLIISAFWWMAAPTKEGRLVMDQIAGFERYLSVTEEDRLERLHPPEKTPELFERFLPFAIALGVENRWASRFSDVLARAATQPDQQNRMGWYSGSHSPWSSPSRFAGAMGASLASSVAAASTAPGSSSGSGGGGSSGGGGGGGGGGGW
jgi:uncharacterized membrane protein YgcG